MQPKGVIFDFDGVIVDSLSAHLGAWIRAVHEIFGERLANPQELSGYSSRTIAHILAKRYGDPSVASTLVKAKERLMLGSTSSVTFYPGVPEVLEHLAKSSTPVAIGSNSSRQFVTNTLTRLGLVVDHIVTASDVSRHKPAPDIFWNCANLMKLSPDHRLLTLVFEDSPHGIKAAIDAGMTPVGITTSVSSAKLLEAGAVITAASLYQALEKGIFESALGSLNGD